ncbi:DMT family transporter [Pelagibius marinus]|uniref:DMT family transporter n=1 Tax=Pelagibius marinus TaxID=2762760 RepID=UPI001872D54B|nr:DMT family transporter [Pelagibius marinus]
MTDSVASTNEALAETKGLLLGFVGVAVFSLTLPVTRLAMADSDPVVFGLGRSLLAGVVAAAILLATRQRLPQGREWRALAVVSAGVIFGFPLLSAWGMQRVPAAHGGVVLGILPLATVAAGAVLLRERPSLGFWLVSLLGGAAVVTFSLLRGGGSLGVGHLALLGSVACAAVGYAEGARLTRSLGGWQVICWALVLSFPLLLIPVVPAALAHGLPGSPQSWAAFLYVALFSQLFGFFAWNRGLAMGGVARVSQVQLLQTFLTIAASSLLLGEAVDAMTLGFAVFVVASVALGRRMPVRR